MHLVTKPERCKSFYIQNRVVVIQSTGSEIGLLEFKSSLDHLPVVILGKLFNLTETDFSSLKLHWTHWMVTQNKWGKNSVLSPHHQGTIEVLLILYLIISFVWALLYISDA